MTLTEFDYDIEKEGPFNWRIIIREEEIVLHNGDQLVIMTSQGEIDNVFYRLASLVPPENNP
jgi:Trk K+ transport system NAD-binding subunit